MIGAKASGLEKLQNLGLNVPQFHVFAHQSFNDMTGNYDVDQALLLALIEQLPFRSDQYAVRSSSAIEDGNEKSFAGQFKTRLHVIEAELPIALFEVWQHFQSYYQQQYSVHKQAPFGIIIQAMIQADCAGIAFSANPMDSDDPTPFLTMIPGIGEPLVGGKVDGCACSFTSGKWVCLDDNQIVSGRVDGKNITCTSQELLREHESVLIKLAHTLKRLQDQLGYEVDTEFAIRDNELFWLQVRPITTRTEKSIAIWDNTAAEINYNGITSPLTASLVRRSFQFAYGAMGKKLGLTISEPTIKQHLHRMSDTINGVLYYNVSAWQNLIAQLPFGKKAASQLPQLWGMDKIHVPYLQRTGKIKRFSMLIQLIKLLLIRKKLHKNYTEKLNHILASKPDENASLGTLKAHYLNTEKVLGENWIAPTINGFFALLFLSLGKKLLKESTLIKEHPNFLNDILQQEDKVITVRMIHDFQEIIFNIQSDQYFYAWFTSTEIEEIQRVLPEKSPKIFDLIQTYLQAYGCKAEKEELKLETIPFKANPTLFYAYLKKNSGITLRRTKSKVNYKAVINNYYSPLNPKRYLLYYTIHQSILRVSDRENYRFDRTKVFDYMRQLFQQMELKLLANKMIHTTGDLIYLSIEELLTTSADNFKTIIETRKLEYSNFAVEDKPSRYRETQSGFLPVAANFSQEDLKGIGCCSGTVTGTIYVYHPEAKEEDLNGKIIIADFFEPGDIALFSAALGLISGRGNLLSHTAILCREMGVPSIVGVKGLMQNLKTGDYVQMNGASGQIKRLNEKI